MKFSDPWVWGHGNLDAQAWVSERIREKKGFVCVTNFILGHNKAENSPSWGSSARLGLSLGHGLVPGRKPVTGFSAPSQPKMGKKRNRMSLLIRKALSGVEGVVWSLAMLSHECGGLISETRSEWSEKGSWSGWSRGCLISFQSVFSSPHLSAAE